MPYFGVDARVKFIKDYNARPAEANPLIILAGTFAIVTGETKANHLDSNGRVYYLHNVRLEQDNKTEVWLVADEYLQCV